MGSTGPRLRVTSPVARGLDLRVRGQGYPQIGSDAYLGLRELTTLPLSAWPVGWSPGAGGAIDIVAAIARNCVCAGVVADRGAGGRA